MILLFRLFFMILNPSFVDKMADTPVIVRHGCPLKRDLCPLATNDETRRQWVLFTFGYYLVINPSFC